MNRFASALIALLSSSSLTFAQAIDAPGGDDDLSGSASVDVITWEPILIEFYAAAEHGTSAVIVPELKTIALAPGTNPESVVGEINQWRALQPAIAPRPAGAADTKAYDDKEPVLSAWHRSVDKDGRVSFVTYGTKNYDVPDPDTKAPPVFDPSKPDPIHTIFAKDHRLLLSCDIGILTNARDEQKDSMLDKHFKVKQYKMTAHKISDDPAKYRQAIPQDAPAIKLAGYDDNAVIFPRFNEAAHTYSRPAGHVTVDLLQAGLGESGAWEIRVKAIIEGKASESDELQTKEVEGAIRLALVSDQKFEVQKIAYDREGGYALYNNKTNQRVRPGKPLVPNLPK